MKLAGLVLLVVLVLVGALMPLKYTARMHLPKSGAGPEGPDTDRSGAGDRSD